MNRVALSSLATQIGSIAGGAAGGAMGGGGSAGAVASAGTGKAATKGAATRQVGAQSGAMNYAGDAMDLLSKIMFIVGNHTGKKKEVDMPPARIQGAVREMPVLSEGY